MKLRCASALLAAALASAGALPPAALASECIQVPVNCPVTSAYGPRYDPIRKNFSSEFHHGMDFGCPIGTPVVAADGARVNVASHSNSAGHWVLTRTAGGSVIKYMHHERNLVAPGKDISKGQQIALTGNSGRSTGPHLHFQLEEGGKAVDPKPRMCTSPPLKEGVLQGGPPPQSDILDGGSQAVAPSDDGGTPPAMGLDGSLSDVLGDVIGSRALNPDYMHQLSTLSVPRLFAEVAYLQSIRLKVRLERSQQRERIQATQAMLQLLRAEAVLRPQLDAQRASASRR